MLDALQRRDRRACEQFVDAHYHGVHRFFLWLTRDTETAADLTQEAFAAFWASVDHLDAAAVPDLKAWLYGIARNRWRKWCRDSRPSAAPLDEALEVPDEAPGPEALAIAAIDSEAIVRLDVMMPGPDGFQVLQALRDDPRTVEIPVVMLTAKGSDDHVRHGWQTGTDFYMAKPFNPAELRAVVDRLAAVAGTPENPAPLRRSPK